MGATTNGNVAAATEKQPALVYPTNATYKKFIAGSGATPIPTSVNTSSPSGSQSSRLVAGGIIYAVWSNDTATNESDTFKPIGLEPGDSVDCTIAGNVLKLTVNGAEVYRSTGAALTAGGFNYFYG